MSSSRSMQQEAGDTDEAWLANSESHSKSSSALKTSNQLSEKNQTWKPSYGISFSTPRRLGQERGGCLDSVEAQKEANQVLGQSRPRDSGSPNCTRHSSFRQYDHQFASSAPPNPGEHSLELKPPDLSHEIATISNAPESPSSRSSAHYFSSPSTVKGSQYAPNRNVIPFQDRAAADIDHKRHLIKLWANSLRQLCSAVSLTERDAISYPEKKIMLDILDEIRNDLQFIRHTMHRLRSFCRDRTMLGDANQLLNIGVVRFSTIVYNLFLSRDELSQRWYIWKRFRLRRHIGKSRERSYIKTRHLSPLTSKMKALKAYEDFFYTQYCGKVYGRIHSTATSMGRLKAQISCFRWFTRNFARFQNNNPINKSGKSLFMSWYGLQEDLDNFRNVALTNKKINSWSYGECSESGARSMAASSRPFLGDTTDDNMDLPSKSSGPGYYVRPPDISAGKDAHGPYAINHSRANTSSTVIKKVIEADLREDKPRIVSPGILALKPSQSYRQTHVERSVMSAALDSQIKNGLSVPSHSPRATRTETSNSNTCTDAGAGREFREPSAALLVDDRHISPLGYHIPPAKLRDSMLSSRATRAAYWQYTLYQGRKGEKVKVHYCKSMATTERIARLFLGQEVIGFDIEWKAQASAKDGIRKNVALVQLATEERIALFHVARFSNHDRLEDLVSPTLKRVMESPSITKVGVAVKGDCSRLRQYLGIESQGLLELSHLYKLVQFSTSDVKKINKMLVSLAKQVEDHLMLPMNKDNNVRASDWSMDLNYQQIYCQSTFTDFMYFSSFNICTQTPRQIPTLASSSTTS